MVCCLFDNLWVKVCVCVFGYTKEWNFVTNHISRFTRITKISGINTFLKHSAIGCTKTNAVWSPARNLFVIASLSSTNNKRWWSWSDGHFKVSDIPTSEGKREERLFCLDGSLCRLLKEMNVFILKNEEEIMIVWKRYLIERRERVWGIWSEWTHYQRNVFHISISSYCNILWFFIYIKWIWWDRLPVLIHCLPFRHPRQSFKGRRL